MDCDCEKCKSCCFNSCGWFGSIEEIEGAAKIMKTPLKEFANEYLIQEWYAGKEEVSIPAPRKNFRKKSKHLKDLHASEKFKEASKVLKRIEQYEKRKNGKGFVRASWSHAFMVGYGCIFLDKNNHCKIHESKPTECRESFGCRESKFKNRKSLVKYWKRHQDFIKKMREEK